MSEATLEPARVQLAGRRWRDATGTAIAYMVPGFNVVTLPIKVFNTLRMGFQPTMCVGAVLFTVIGLTAFALVAAVGDLPKLLGGKT